MSQRQLSKLIYAVPANLQTRSQRNLPAAADAWNAEKDRILGVRGTRKTPSRPGDAPREQTGVLRAGTRAIAAASSLTIRMMTTAVGKYLNDGTPRVKRRPFANTITRQAAAAMKAALYKP